MKERAVSNCADIRYNQETLGHSSTASLRYWFVVFLPHTMGVPENRGGPWCLEWPGHLMHKCSLNPYSSSVGKVLLSSHTTDR